MDPEAEPAAAKGPAPEEEVATLIFCCIVVGVSLTYRINVREGETDLFCSRTLGLLWTRSKANVSDDSRDGGRWTGCT
jgi:hypothetical protein